MYALNGLKRFYPNSFDIEAITVDLGFEGFNLEPIKDLCHTLGVTYTVVHSILDGLFSRNVKKRIPCSLCAKMRKGAFNDKAKELGCNKIAYGHHRDDLVETMLLSLIFEGRFYSFSPVTYLDRMDLTLIRPLMYVQEADVVDSATGMLFPWPKAHAPLMAIQKGICEESGKTTESGASRRHR